MNKWTRTHTHSILKYPNETRVRLTDLIRSVVEVGLDSLHQLGEGGFVLGVDVGECQAGGGLAVDHAAQASLALHDGVGHSHLATQGRQEQHNLAQTQHVLI